MSTTTDAGTVIVAARPAPAAWVFDDAEQVTAVTAAAASRVPVEPPADWFDPDAVPELDGPLTFTSDGRVFGLLAPRDIDHIGLPGQHRRAPYSPSNYSLFHTGQVRCDDGTLVSTGRLTMLTGHADLDLDAQGAAAHYDHSGSAVADVVAWDTPGGVMCAGAARPGVTPEQMRMAMASPPSGDWRQAKGRDLEMVAALLVNTAGFPMSRAALAASGEVRCLVASGAAPFRMIAASQAPTRPTPTEESSVSQSEPDTPEALAAAAGFAEGEPTPDDDGSGFDSGDSVQIEGTDLVGQFVEAGDDGTVVVQLAVPADLLSHADEDQAMAAAASFSDRMHMRRQSADITKLTASQLAQTETIGKLTASLEQRDRQLDTLLATERSREAERLIASAGIEA